MPDSYSPPLRHLRGPWPIALLLFIASLWLFTRNNTFSFDYHPDEDGKVFQIIERERNFHHPLLLLNATDLAVHIARVPLKEQPVVVAGRWVSSAFAAGAVATLALAAFYRAGSLAAWIVGLLVATHPELYKAAHYLKEDSALMFGVGLFFLATEWFARSPNLRAVRFLGIACAVAASGKYVGIITLPFALAILWRAREPVPALRWKGFGIAFLATFFVLNVPPTTHPASPFRSLRREVIGVTEGHRGLTREVPHAKYVPELREDVPLPLMALSGVAMLALAVAPRKRTGAEWTLAIFPIIFFTMLSFSPKTGGRYLLPVTTILCALGGIGVVELARLLRPVYAQGLVIGSTIFLVNAQWPLLSSTIHDFQQDDRIALAAWIRANVPPDAILVEDHRVNLLALTDGAPLPQRILDNDYAADLGTIDEMRTWGPVYVAVSQRAYDRFFTDLKPRASEKADFDRRKEFYARLFAEADLVQEWKSRGIMYLQPGLKLYRLRPTSG